MTARDFDLSCLPWRAVARIGLVILVLLAANWFAAWLTDALKFELTPRTEHIAHTIIMASVAAYMILIAVPFVPGIEIGLLLLVMGGVGLAPLVYGATVIGLTLGFLSGHFLPQGWLIRTLEACRLERAARLVDEMEHLDRQARLDMLMARAPSRIGPFLLRHRYIALALALNLPGNAVIGGGGGICLVAGMTRLYSTRGFLLTVLIATAPVPLGLLLFGPGILPQ
jgi:hypothetical protein